jgi:hypothetical protein
VKLMAVPNLRSLMIKAWGIARHLAKHHDGSPRTHIASALHQSWAEAKRTAREIAGSRARVQAEVERIRALHTPEATANRAAEMAAFQARFPRGSSGRAFRRAACW